MADVAAIVVTLVQVTCSICKRVRGFLERARVSDQFAQDLLCQLQQARQLVERVRRLEQECRRRRSFQSESESWSHILETLEHFERYLRRLDHEVEGLPPASGVTLLKRAWLQWMIDGRSEVIENIKSDLGYQMTNVNASLSCLNM